MKINLILLALSLNFSVLAQVETSSFPKIPSAITSNGPLAVAYDGEAYFINPGSSGDNAQVVDENWVPFLAQFTDLPSDEIQDVYNNKDKFYFATDKGLAIKEGDDWKIVNESNSNITSEDLMFVYADDEIEILSNEDVLSYKLASETTWTNVSFSSLGSGIAIRFPIRPCFLDDIIYIPFRFGYFAYDINNNSSNRVAVQSMRELQIHNNQIIAAVSSATGSDLYYCDKDTVLQITNNDICGASNASINSAFPSHHLLTGGTNNLLFFGSNWSSTSSMGLITDDELLTTYSTDIVPQQYQVICYDEKLDLLCNASSGIAYSVTNLKDHLKAGSSYAGILDVNQRVSSYSNRSTFDYDKESPNNNKVPKTECATTTFAGNVWIGGVDDSDNLHLAAMTYRQRGDDFWPGPLDESTGNTTANQMEDYDRVWKVDKSDLKHHIELFRNNGSVSPGQTAQVIWDWPAHRPEDQSKILAPFVDQNTNGIYEPEMGDYPDVPGDQCIFWIMNDNGGVHGETGGDPLKVEIHGMAYAYNCPKLLDDKSGINFTHFIKYNVINRSGSDFKDVIFTNWVDVDLGNYADDYVGCLVTDNAAVGYNGDLNDEGDKGYGERPPAEATVILNAPGFEHDGIDGDGDGEIDEFDERRLMGSFFYFNNNANQINGNPITPTDYYNYMQGKFKNGSNVEYGGDGITNTDGTVASYMFPFDSDPDHAEFWSEGDWRGTPNVPSDRRYIQSTYPFTLNANDTVEYEFARIYSRDLTQDDPFPKLKTEIRSIKDWYYSDRSLPECFNPARVEDLIAKESYFAIYPNPATNRIEVLSKLKIESVTAYDIRGIALELTPTLSEKNRKALIDINELVPGVYVLELNYDGKKATEKFVVY